MDLQKIYAQIQPIPIGMLHSIAKQYGVSLSEKEIKTLKRQLQHYAEKNASIEECIAGLSKNLNKETLKQLNVLLNQFK